MRFENLPENWTTLPLDDAPLAAGVIDLVVGFRDRLRNSLLILPCDHRDVGLPAPVLASDVDWSEPAPLRREKMSLLPQIPAAGFVVALSARHRLPDQLVRGWIRTVEDTLDASGQALLAFGVADMDHVEIVGGRAARNGSLGAAS
ncbi:hypothetical protein G6016_03100 [Dietzia aerolata]|uniref:Uncharacterized protein n=1 Tax=Dietzia aerolata TaxID=595984 RepID=A0ABV5JQE7_9ACTN|nr:hypothetical protein [Dietzia aerolata]MBB0967960.1 hypothetical protein [Dietzia aerolata]